MLNGIAGLIGNYSLYGAATPILHSLLRKAAKKIVNPDPSEVKQGRTTVYDTWKLNNPDPGNHKQPKYEYPSTIILAFKLINWLLRFIEITVGFSLPSFEHFSKTISNNLKSKSISRTNKKSAWKLQKKCFETKF